MFCDIFVFFLLLLLLPILLPLCNCVFASNFVCFHISTLCFHISTLCAPAAPFGEWKWLLRGRLIAVEIQIQNNLTFPFFLDIIEQLIKIDNEMLLTWATACQIWNIEAIWLLPIFIFQIIAVEIKIKFYRGNLIFGNMFFTRFF